MGALVVIPGMASETKTKFNKNSLVAIAIAKTFPSSVTQEKYLPKRLKLCLNEGKKHEITLKNSFKMQSFCLAGKRCHAWRISSHVISGLESSDIVLC